MSEPAFDARELRNVLSVFVTGVTVITTVDASGKAYGLTANSFSSVSLDPPLILWSQSLNAASFPVFRDAAHFAVSILADDQVEISNGFAKGSQLHLGHIGVVILYIFAESFGNPFAFAPERKCLGHI